MNTLLTGERNRTLGDEHAALRAACDPDVSLCTIVGIEGSFSRRLGAQLAINPDGTVVGSLADGCLEQQIVTDTRIARGPSVRRYGRGSPNIDFRLPCGGGLDILLDPAPDREACRMAVTELAKRRATSLRLPPNPLLERCNYIPALHVRAFGEGPELAAVESVARAAGISIDALDKSRLSLGRQPDIPAADRWTAIVLLFHDHEWEDALLHQALRSDAFYIGAQGGESARISRNLRLLNDGMAEEQIALIRSPVGVIPACRTPGAIALSILAEIVGEYERSRHAA